MIVISQYVAAHMSCNIILIVNNFRGVSGNMLHDCDCAYVEMGTLTVVEGDSVVMGELGIASLKQSRKV